MFSALRLGLSPLRGLLRINSFRFPAVNWRKIGAALGLLGLSGFFGLVAAYLGYFADIKALYYVVALGFIIAVPFVVLSRENPARFTFTALLVGLPAVAFIVPPGRLGITVFDYGMLFLLMATLWKRLVASNEISDPLFPTPVFWIIQILSVPLVIFAQFPGIAAWVFLENFLIYTFFLAMLQELASEDGGESLLLLFSIAVIILAIGGLFEKVTHINLSLHGTNINQITLAAGAFIHRAGGFFQDPQKAAQFMGCAGVLLFSVALGRRFRHASGRMVVVLACLAAFAALLLTASRSALLAALLMIPFVIMFGTRGGVVIKLMAFIVVSIIVFTGILVPTDVLVGLLPKSVSSRLGSLEESLYFRIRVWFDTWEMFANHRLTGIGLGGFQSYLLRENPAMQSYMGIGGALGAGYVPDQPESGYFKILYEGGLLGCLASALLVMAALRRAWRVLVSSVAPPEWKVEVIGSLASLVVFGLSFITLFTMSDERNAVILILPLAIIWARSMALDAAVARLGAGR